MTRSLIIAISLTLLLAVWVVSGLLSGGGDNSATGEADPADRELFRVVVRPIAAEDFTHQLKVRGRTEAVRSVTLKAEIEGAIVATPVERGTRVAKGDLICRIATNEREANVARADALLAQRRLEFEAAKELAEKGHRSTQQVATARALLEAAEAELRLTRVALDNTRITAPFDAIVEDRLAEVGDYLQKGGACARLVDEDPFLAVGEVSENDVGAVAPGAATRILFADGRQADARIRFISQTASERTRTFRLEAAFPNPDRSFREGLTVDIMVPLATRRAHLIPSSALVLNAGGEVGIRMVDGDGDIGIARFVPVGIIGQDADGLWVSGLPERVRLILIGQEFVSDGQTVLAVPEEGRV